MKQTSLHDVHAALGAKLIDFGGWRMPVQYGPILDEVRRVRSAAACSTSATWDASISGKDAVRMLDRVVTNFVAKIPVGAIRYSLLCRADGNPIDDLLVYRRPDAVYRWSSTPATPRKTWPGCASRRAASTCRSTTRRTLGHARAARASARTRCCRRW
jgi:glycine cleavage system aminomethyltransferase T